ncbi:hypothetical protein [Streptomyces sp. NPDC051098]|uniref:hypothetical protein n=1 Tax=Streptomyces sp. NPDC051098 TaxID=3155411 RepID=UPI003435DE58
MDVVLDPPSGVVPVGWRCSSTKRSPRSPRGPHEVEHDEEENTIHTSCGDVRVNVLLEGVGRAVTAVELWWPVRAVRVLLDGDVVFVTPAEDLIRRAARRGRAVDASEAEYPFVPRFSLGFTRLTVKRCPAPHEGFRSMSPRSWSPARAPTTSGDAGPASVVHPVCGRRVAGRGT